MGAGTFLETMPLLAGMAPAARAELAAAMQPFSVGDDPADALLFRQGDPASGLYLLEAGLLEIATRIPGDDAAAVSRIAPGEVVGEFALLDPGPRTASVRALAPSKGLLLGARHFAAMLAEGRAGAVALADRLRTLVAGRTRATLERIASGAPVEPSELRSAAAAAEQAAAPADPGLLSALAPFAALPPTQRSALLGKGELIEAPRGAALFASASASTAAFCVIRGAVRMAIERGVRLEQVAIHGPGEWAGLVAMIDGGAQPLAASAAETSLLLRVPRAAFDRWRRAPGRVGAAVLAAVDPQLVRDQRRANRHLGRAIALERFNAAGATG